jgi:hypothetical protein
LRAILPARSSEHALQRDACHFLLAGEKGSNIALKLRAPTGDETSLTLTRMAGAGRRPLARPAPADLTRQRFVH